MNYYLYKMKSTDPAPPWGSRKDWFYYYKWGRPEVVSFLKEEPHYKDVAVGDALFFVLDDVVLGFGLVLHINEGYLGVGAGPVQEIDIQGDAILELKKKIRLKGEWGDRIPRQQGLRWISRKVGYAEYQEFSRIEEDRDTARRVL